MSLNAKEVSGVVGKFDEMEAGNYPARFCGIVDLGLQPQSFQGETKPPCPEIMLSYEFVSEFLKDEDGNDREDKPRHLSERIPFRNLKAAKAKSTKRYLALDPKVTKNGEWRDLISSPCTVTVVQNQSKTSDRVFANISSVAPPIKGMSYPGLKNPPRIFDRNDPDMGVFEALPDWVQKVIMESLDFHSTKLAKVLEAAPAKKAEAPKGGKDAVDLMDDAPF